MEYVVNPKVHLFLNNRKVVESFINMKGSRKTSRRVGRIASKVLKNKRYGRKSRALAGTALSQRAGR